LGTNSSTDKTDSLKPNAVSFKPIRIIAVALMCILFNGCYAQNSVRCRVLHTVLLDKNVSHILLFNQHTELPIVFVDTANFLKNCIIEKTWGRDVHINNSSAELTKLPACNYEINSFKETADFYEVYISYKYTGAYGRILVKKNTNKLKVYKYDIGFF
jgi:hypothetical protein